MSDPVFPTPRPWSEAGAAEAKALFDSRCSANGSLGKLREVAAWWRGATGVDRPPTRARLCVFAADHGVVARGVTADGPDSAERVRRLLWGEAAVSRLARHADVELLVFDVGMWSADSGAIGRRVRAGTADFTREAAMTVDEARAAIQVGIACVREAAEDGVDVLAVGEISPGGSTAAAAVLSAIAAVPGKLAAGRGSGLDDAGLARKVRAIDDAIALHRPARSDGLGVLAAVGGLEIAAVTGMCLGGAAFGIPVVLDGFVSTAGALVASVIEPGCVQHLLMGHRSTENGHWAMARYLRREPLLDLDMSVTEGVGAVMAVQMVRMASSLSQRF